MYRTIYTRPAIREDQQIRALKSLRSEEFNPVVRFIEDKLQNALDTLETAVDKASLYRAQGRAKAYEELLELIEARP